jgi:predicted flap endonuclease-1-like 5' DNA nuclease
MVYLILQTLFWVALAFILGMLIGKWLKALFCKNKTQDRTVQTKTIKPKTYSDSAEKLALRDLEIESTQSQPNIAKGAATVAAAGAGLAAHALSTDKAEDSDSGTENTDNLDLNESVEIPDIEVTSPQPPALPEADNIETDLPDVDLELPEGIDISEDIAVTDLDIDTDNKISVEDTTELDDLNLVEKTQIDASPSAENISLDSDDLPESESESESDDKSILSAGTAAIGVAGAGIAAHVIDAMESDSPENTAKEPLTNIDEDISNVEVTGTDEAEIITEELSQTTAQTTDSTPIAEEQINKDFDSTIATLKDEYVDNENQTTIDLTQSADTTETEEIIETEVAVDSDYEIENTETEKETKIELTDEDIATHTEDVTTSEIVNEEPAETEDDDSTLTMAAIGAAGAGVAAHIADAINPDDEPDDETDIETITEEIEGENLGDIDISAAENTEEINISELPEATDQINQTIDTESDLVEENISGIEEKPPEAEKINEDLPATDEHATEIDDTGDTGENNTLAGVAAAVTAAGAGLASKLTDASDENHAEVELPEIEPDIEPEIEKVAEELLPDAEISTDTDVLAELDNDDTPSLETALDDTVSSDVDDTGEDNTLAGVAAAVTAAGAGLADDHDKPESTDSNIDSTDATDLSLYEHNDLRIVHGIGSKVEALLKEANINTWEELANTRVEKLQDILDAAGDNFQSADPATWAKQASMAINGAWDELSVFQDTLDA